ncbi:Vacuolar protein sorting-associated protein 51 [Gonapodya sp. JEL0774]|nr:Vacuolar protein sorting-associated protein 51 [Gonapodya sp. JEL0774]
MSIRDLKIKTGVLKRLSKELESYHKEHEQQRSRVDKMVQEGKDEHDVRKQLELGGAPERESGEADVDKDNSSCILAQIQILQLQIEVMREVLEETTNMIPDCKKRLAAAHTELEQLVAVLVQKTRSPLLPFFGRRMSTPSLPPSGPDRIDDPSLLGPRRRTRGLLSAYYGIQSTSADGVSSIAPTSGSDAGHASNSEPTALDVEAGKHAPRTTRQGVNKAMTDEGRDKMKEQRENSGRGGDASRQRAGMVPAVVTGLPPPTREGRVASVSSGAPQTQQLEKEKRRKKADAADINSPSFDPDRYVNKMQSEAGVVELIARDNGLIHAITALDGEMKTLVYENYSKFITATETIGKMESSLPSARQSLDELTQSVDAVSSQVLGVSAAMAEKRAKIQKLGGVVGVLQKSLLLAQLQFLFDLPPRLHHFLGSANFSQAVRSYARTSRLLRRYAHLAAFRRVADECEQVMKEIEKGVEMKMRSEKSSIAEVTEMTELLIGLGRNPKELSKEYLKCVTMQLVKLRASAESEISKLEVEITEVEQRRASTPGAVGLSGDNSLSPSNLETLTPPRSPYHLPTIQSGNPLDLRPLPATRGQISSETDAETTFSPMNPSSAPDPPPKPVDPLVIAADRKVDILNETYLSAFALFVESYDAMFLSGASIASASPTSAQALREGGLRPGMRSRAATRAQSSPRMLAAVGASNASLINSGPGGDKDRGTEVAGRFVAKMTTEEVAECKWGLEAALGEMERGYLDVVETMVGVSMSSPATFSPAPVIRILDRLHTAVLASVPLKKVAHMDLHIRHLTIGVLRRTFEAQFAEVFGQIGVKFVGVGSAAPSELDLATWTNDTAMAVAEAMVGRCLDVIESFLAPSHEFINLIRDGRTVCLEIVRQTLREFWQTLVNGITSYTNGQTNDASTKLLSKTSLAKSRSPRPPPRTILAISGVLRELGARFGERVYLIFAERLYGVKRKGRQDEREAERERERNIGIGQSSTRALRGEPGGSGPTKDGDNGGGTPADDFLDDGKEVVYLLRDSVKEVLSCYAARAGDALADPLKNFYSTTEWTAGRGAVSTWSQPAGRVVEGLLDLERDVGGLYGEEERKERTSFGGNASQSTSKFGQPYPYSASMGSASGSGSFSPLTSTFPSNSSTYPYHAGPNSSTLSSLGNLGTVLAKSGGRYDQNLMSGIDKLFAEKVVYYGKVEASRSGVLLATIRIVLKALVETVRAQTFGREGFHQLQIDSELFRAKLWPFVPDPKQLHSLVEEILASGSKRCLDPRPLARDTIDRIVSTFDSTSGVMLTLQQSPSVVSSSAGPVGSAPHSPFGYGQMPMRGASGFLLPTRMGGISEAAGTVE